jgi:hypothetical protein
LVDGDANFFTDQSSHSRGTSSRML